MWGWAEQAKKLAANLDQQLNESVGIQTTDSTSASAGVSLSTSNNNNNNDSGVNDDDDNLFLDDAWNDDDIDGLDTTVSSTHAEIIPPSSAVASSPMISHTPVTVTDKVSVSVEELQEQPQPQQQQQQQQAAAPLQGEVAESQVISDEVRNHDGNDGGWAEDDVNLDVHDNPIDTSTATTKKAETKPVTPVTATATITTAREVPNNHGSVPVPVEEFTETKETITEEGWVDEDDLDFADEKISNNQNPNQQQPQMHDGTFTPKREQTIKEEQINDPLQTTTTVTSTPNDNTATAATSVGESLRIIQDLKHQLAQREEQLSNKSMQMTTMQSMFEAEKQELIQKLKDTKEEAKKRIAKARERIEQTEKNASQNQGLNQEQLAKQNQIIDALREEGEKLALKQSEMEKTTRAARAEIRELKESLEDETQQKETALSRIEELQQELKETRNDLTSARKGETLSQKLDNQLQASKEDISNKANTILSLEQQIKEQKATIKELQSDLQQGRRSAALENERELQKSRKELNDVIGDLETKLRTNEREAGLREDALRNEVIELRKRWQDAIRRADGLSMDVQSSTAPLLRQLESMEKQNRARASAWAELETKLRNELEENVIQNEKAIKERNEFKSKCNRYERVNKENENELNKNSKTMEEQVSKIQNFENKIMEMEKESSKLQEEYNKVEQLANEGVTKVRSEMSTSLIESEERYRNQIESLETELRIEKDKRKQLEQQVQQLLDSVGMIPTTANVNHQSSPARKILDTKPRKLKEQSEGQAEILAGALNGLGSGDDDDDNYDSHNRYGDNDYNDDNDAAAAELSRNTSGSGNAGFAAIEQLTQSLKAAKSELEALRKSLKESEKTRENLIQELSESRQAKEKLPLFEEKVKELAADNRIKELEIESLKDDVSEVRELYRTQLNVLIEEKAAAATMAAKEEEERKAATLSSPPRQARTNDDANAGSGNNSDVDDNNNTSEVLNNKNEGDNVGSDPAEE